LFAGAGDPVCCGDGFTRVNAAAAASKLVEYEEGVVGERVGSGRGLGEGLDAGPAGDLSSRRILLRGHTSIPA
jgi:hypothetical protein